MRCTDVQWVPCVFPKVIFRVSRGGSQRCEGPNIFRTSVSVDFGKILPSKKRRRSCVACLRRNVNAQTLFYVHLEPKQEHVTTNYRSHKLHKDSESRVHKDTRSQKLELKKQNRLRLNKHICVELCTLSLKGSEDSLSLQPALLPGCPVCPQSCVCVMAKGIGHLPYKARHKQLPLEGSTRKEAFLFSQTHARSCS